MSSNIHFLSFISANTFVLAFIVVIVWACITVGKERKETQTVEEHWHDCPSILDGPTVELELSAKGDKAFSVTMPLTAIAKVGHFPEDRSKAYVEFTNGECSDCWDTYDVVIAKIEQAKQGYTRSE